MPVSDVLLQPGDPHDRPTRADAESDAVTIVRIKAEARVKIVSEVTKLAGAVLTPVGAALVAWWLSHLGTKVEQVDDKVRTVETRQVENAERIEKVHQDVGAVRKNSDARETREGKGAGKGGPE